MNAKDLVAELSTRADKIDDWRFNVETMLDEDEDGEVTLTVIYDEKHEYTDEPWNTFGPLPIENTASGMDEGGRNTVYQWVSWKVCNGVVA